MTSLVSEPKKTGAVALTVLLSISSFALAVLNIEALLNIGIALFSLFSGDAKAAAALAMPLTCALGFAALIFIVVTSEYHFRHVGSARSRRLFAVTLATQAVLAAIGFLVV